MKLNVFTVSYYVGEVEEEEVQKWRKLGLAEILFPLSNDNTRTER